MEQIPCSVCKKPIVFGRREFSLARTIHCVNSQGFLPTYFVSKLDFELAYILRIARAEND